MVIEVDDPRIRPRADWQSRGETPSIDLWVMLPGLDRLESAEAVRAALTADEASTLPTPSSWDTYWIVYPTAGGTFVWVDDATQWEPLVATLVQNLTSAGHHRGTVTLPNHIDREELYRDLPQPVALVAYRMDPPIEAGPWNQWGMPARRWGVPQATTEQIIDATAVWVPLPDGAGDIVEGAVIPATSEDAADLLRIKFDRQRKPLSFSSVASGRRARSVTFDDFGQAAYLHLDPSHTPVRLAEDLVPWLTRHPEALDVGAIRPMLSSFLVSWRSLPQGSRWHFNRHLWSSRIHDVTGIQLLTGAHLAHAHDLSGWQVTQVAPDRWLVRAPDLEPWYDVPDRDTWNRRAFPHPDVLAQARSDFGDMILTDEIAEAHPRPTATR